MTTQHDCIAIAGLLSTDPEALLDRGLRDAATLPRGSVPVVVGLNHDSAPVEVRERVAFGSGLVEGALGSLGGSGEVEEAVVVSTCNRTEVYAVVGDEPGWEGRLRGWLERERGLEPGWLKPYVYAHRGEGAVRHLLGVASGLDSLVLGEPQILGQTKGAYQAAVRAGVLGRRLSRLFQQAFAAAKQVRSETAIGARPVSVAYAAVSLARQIFASLEGRRALLVGAGEMIELTARHLAEQGLGGVVVANRSVERARRLAAVHGGEAIALGEIGDHLAGVDMVVSCTGSELPVLGKGLVERALRRRRHAPLFMVDLAIPRDIEPEVGELADVYLYGLDDLREVIEEGRRARAAAAEQAELILEAHVERYLAWERTQAAVGSIRAYRAQAAATREELLEQARRRLARGEDPEAVLEQLARRLTNRLIHAPTIGLRQAAHDADARQLRGLSLLLLDAIPPEEDETET